jgi:hypothetical protein
MSTDLRARRAAWAWRIIGLAAALAVLAWVVVSIRGHALRGDAVAGPVVPALTETRMESVRRIAVRSLDGTFTIERGPAGWIMRERGDYPVRPQAVTAVAAALRGLAFERRMTSDPEKLDRIGLGDPSSGGRGVLLQMEDEQGALVVDMIVGVASETGGVYVREADDNQAWAVSGDLPDLRDPAAWLALRPFEVAADSIVRVDVAPAEGRAYGLIRPTAESAIGFIFAPPLSGVQPSAAVSLEDLALRILSIDPIDVAPAASVQAPPRARLALTTNANMIIDAEIVSVGQDSWLKFSARPTVDTPEAVAAAQAINAGSSAWAYKLTTNAADGLTPVYETLLPAAAVAEPLPFTLP